MYYCILGVMGVKPGVESELEEAMSVMTIVTGGQTGVDRAALDAAIAANYSVGGACPAGRRAEDGPIPSRYPLRELASDSYETRTLQNVQDADGTLVLNVGPLEDGTAQTVMMARSRGKPLLVLQLEEDIDVELVCGWLREHNIRILNVAGPRESKRPGVYERAQRFMAKLLALRP